MEGFAEDKVRIYGNGNQLLIIGAIFDGTTGVRVDKKEMISVPNLGPKARLVTLGILFVDSVEQTVYASEPFEFKYKGKNSFSILVLLYIYKYGYP
jgi:hypothetical protein